MARTVAKDYDHKRRLILARAAEVFATQGFDRASVSSVAKACEISKANIYHYYGSKDDILFDILDSHLSELRDRICGMDLSGLDAETAFQETILEILMTYQGADNAHRLQTERMRSLPEDKAAILRSHQRELVNHVSGLVKQLAPSVFTGDAAKLQAVTMSLFGMLNWYNMWNDNADKKARRAYARTVSTIALRGIPAL